MLSRKLSIGKVCTVIVRQTSGEALAIGENDSNARRLLSLAEFFFVLSFVSMIVLHGRKGRPA